MFIGKTIGTSALTLTLCVGAASAQLQFQPAVNYATPTRPSGVTAADFNADGLMDLAVTTDNPDRVTIFLGTGGGAFGAPNRFNVPNGSGLGAITAGDFDGDRDVDLAVVLKNSNRVAIMLNSGTGSFLIGPLSNVGALPTDIEAADLDGNGTLDLVTANRDGNSASILLNDGTAGFAVTTVAAGSEPREVALGDLDENGSVDMVITLHESRQIARFLNTGGGTFSAPALSGAAGERPEGGGIADVNNDGFNDVLFTVGDDQILGQNQVGLYLGNGTGALTNLRLFPSNGLDSSRLVTADFNNDGFADVAVTNEASNTISVLTGGANGLSAPLLLSVGTNPDGIVAADLNGDGRADLAGSNRDSDNTSVLLQPFRNTCAADFNRDGTPDFFDYLDFVAAFSGNQAAADFNRDTVIDFFDYLDFVAAFSAGC